MIRLHITDIRRDVFDGLEVRDIRIEKYSRKYGYFRNLATLELFREKYTNNSWCLWGARNIVVDYNKNKFKKLVKLLNKKKILNKDNVPVIQLNWNFVDYIVDGDTSWKRLESITKKKFFVK